MQKLDHKKILKHLYNPSPKQVVAVDLPPMNYLMIDGRGDPNTSEDYKTAVETLYALSYALKFMSKKELDTDYVVLPLEGLWDMAIPFQEFNFATDKHLFIWTMMIMQPDFIIEEMVNRVREQVRKKKNPANLDQVRFDCYAEGLSAQIMHIGPYADEARSVALIDAFVAEQGCIMHKKHHEIYLGDPRKVAPEKLKTILRHPMTKA